MGSGKRCWNCDRDNADGSPNCGWCGVWLVDLNTAGVPSAVRCLLPLSRRWGIGDDIYRDEAVEEADTETLAALVAAVDAVDDTALYGWLTGPEASSGQYSAEWEAVTCLTMAADLARVRLRKLGLGD